jgi:hypothetical protein
VTGSPGGENAVTGSPGGDGNETGSPGEGHPTAEGDVPSDDDYSSDSTDRKTRRSGIGRRLYCPLA